MGKVQEFSEGTSLIRYFTNVKYLFFLNFLFAQEPGSCINNKNSTYFVVSYSDKSVEGLKYSGKSLISLENIEIKKTVKCPEFNQITKNAVAELKKKHLLKKAITLIEEL